MSTVLEVYNRVVHCHASQGRDGRRKRQYVDIKTENRAAGDEVGYLFTEIIYGYSRHMNYYKFDICWRIYCPVLAVVMAYALFKNDLVTASWNLASAGWP